MKAGSLLLLKIMALVQLVCEEGIGAYGMVQDNTRTKKNESTDYSPDEKETRTVLKLHERLARCTLKSKLTCMSDNTI